MGKKTNFIILLTIVAVFVISAFVSIKNTIDESTKERQRIAFEERKAFIADSIATQMAFITDSIAREDSIVNAQRNAEIIRTHKNLFRECNDEFNDVVWYIPKSAPRYVNMNGVYCYFEAKSSNFRFKFQYHADDWLFIDNLIFNIDGENITIVPDMKRDCGNGGRIWEWCDENINNDRATLNEYFIKKIANAKTVKIRMNGSQYYNTRVLTAAQIKSIKNTYEYYIALGGKFEY